MRIQKWIAFIVGLVFACAGAAAEIDSVGQSRQQATATAEAQSSLRAYVDPATGNLRDTPPDGPHALETEAAPGPNFDLMWEEVLPDGTVLLHHEGQLEITSTATLQADGSLHHNCGNGAGTQHSHAAPKLDRQSERRAQRRPQP